MQDAAGLGTLYGVRPTEVQRQAWPAIAAGGHVLVSAPTGSGKTLAAFGPILEQLVRAPWLRDRSGSEARSARLPAPLSTSVRCLYVAPLKALARDVCKNLRRYRRRLLAHGGRRPRIVLRTGDTPAQARQRLWLDPPEVLLTTPESLALLLSHSGAAGLFGGLRHVVVDEVHALAQGKRGADLALGLERLAEVCAAPPQRVGLSATATPLDEAARYLTGGRDCTIVRIDESTPLELTIRPLSPGLGFLPQLVERLLPEIERWHSTLVFTSTRRLAEQLAWALRRRVPAWDAQIAVHHSSLAADRRRQVERDFKRGRLRAVVSSTSLELGIDVGAVDLVVLVHPPGDVVRLLQRVGRAGHGPGRVRRGLVLTASTAELLEAVVTVSSGREGQCEPLQVPDHPLDVLCQQLLGMAVMHPWTADEAFALVRRSYPYRDLKRSDIESCLDYLSGGAAEKSGEHWLPSRLCWEGDRFSIRDSRTLRIVRRNLGTILADEQCQVILESRTIEGEERRSSLVGTVEEPFVERLEPGDRFL